MIETNRLTDKMEGAREGGKGNRKTDKSVIIFK